MFQFKLPDLGEGVHEGEILKWHVQVGDTIREDEPLVDVETDKAAVTIPSPRSGKVTELGAPVGQQVVVGQVIVVIDDGADAGQAPGAGKAGGEAPETGRAPAPGQAAAKADGRGAAPAPRTPPAQDSSASGPVAQQAATQDALARSEGLAPAPSVVLPTPDQAVVAAPPAPPPPAAGSEPPPRPDRVAGPVPAAPATRRLARELGVDLQSVKASGPAGRVTPEDVERAAAASRQPPAVPAPEQAPAAVAQEAERAPEQPSAPAAAATAGQHPAFGPAGIPFLEVAPLPDFSQQGPVTREPLRSIRRKVAQRMTTSMILVPHVAHLDEADVTALDALRQRVRERSSGQPGAVKLTLLPFVMRAVLAGLREAPFFNASLDPFAGEVIHKHFYNLGFAADTDRGLLVPVVRGADRLSVLGLAAELERLAGKARAGTLEVDELRGGTFTITNIGALGGTGLIPAINYPEAAILGLGRAQDKPVVRDGCIVIRKMLPLTLAFDHRIADGADAARFMAQLVRRLADPEALLVET